MRRCLLGADTPGTGRGPSSGGDSVSSVPDRAAGRVGKTRGGDQHRARGPRAAPRAPALAHPRPGGAVHGVDHRPAGERGRPDRPGPAGAGPDRVLLARGRPGRRPDAARARHRPAAGRLAGPDPAPAQRLRRQRAAAHLRAAGRAAERGPRAVVGRGGARRAGRRDPAGADRRVHRADRATGPAGAAAAGLRRRVDVVQRRGGRRPGPGRGDLGLVAGRRSAHVRRAVGGGPRCRAAGADAVPLGSRWLAAGHGRRGPAAPGPDPAAAVGDRRDDAVVPRDGGVPRRLPGPRGGRRGLTGRVGRAVQRLRDRCPPRVADDGRALTSYRAAPPGDAGDQRPGGRVRRGCRSYRPSPWRWC